MSGAARTLVVLVTLPSLHASMMFMWSVADERARASRQTGPDLDQGPAAFVGVGSCAAMACHGGTRPNERHEYTTWIEQDRHSHAFLVLYDERALQMATNLGIERPEQDNRCLSCHSTAQDSPRGPKFSWEDGVSCEACHGPADRWLVPHSKPDWKDRPSTEKYGSLRMTNTKDVVVRAGVCVKCHVGEWGREVNHDLIAAGHPRLMFELDAYTANMPPHWREPAGETAPLGAHVWAVGQAVAARQSLALLADRASRGDWPEFAEFECGSCHHELTPKSWRRESGFGDRRAGSPVWSSPQFVLAARQSSATAQRALLEQYGALRKLLQRTSTPAGAIDVEARRSMEVVTELIDQTAVERWDRDRARRLLADLAAEPPIESLDYSTAAYTTMALGAVFESLVDIEQRRPVAEREDYSGVRRALGTLYDDVQQESWLDAREFVAHLQSFRLALPQENQSGLSNH